MDKLYADLCEVLKSVRFGSEILDLPLIPHNSENVNVDNLLEHPGETSISTKLSSGAYSTKSEKFEGSETENSSSVNTKSLTGPKLLAWDLKLAFGRLISGLAQNSHDYDEVAKTFRSIMDLLVREVSRIAVTAPEPDLEQQARAFKDFMAVSAELVEFNSETFWITAANGPLFMSQGNKAPIDPRDTAVAGSVHTTKLLPHTARTKEQILGRVSPANSRFPQPNATPTNLLGKFVHPNAHSAVTPAWMDGIYGTFAPAYDSGGAVVDNRDAMGVYTEAILAASRKASEGAQQVETDAAMETENSASGNISPTTSNDQKPLTGTQGADHLMTGVEGDPAAFGVSEPQHLRSEPHLSPEDIQLLMRWTPYSFVDDDEIESAKSGNQHELLSKTLLNLQTAQTNRLNTPGGMEISDLERHLAYKSANILQRLAAVAPMENINLKIDTRLPVTMTNYAGSLPAATDPIMSPPPMFNQRLQTLSSFKTRGRPKRV